MPGGLIEQPRPRRAPPPLPPRPLAPEALAKLKGVGAPPPLPPRRRPPPLPAPLGPEALAELAAELEAPTRPRGRHVRGGAPLPDAEALEELAAPPPSSPGARSETALVNPEIFSVLERYRQADRGAVKKGLGRLFSTRPGAAAIAPTNVATPQQLQAAGATIGLVSQIADLSAKIAALDADSDGATKAQQEATGNRARAAVWEKSGVPVDMRPLRSGVLGAEISANRASFQEERVQARAAAQAKADKEARALVTKERALKATLKESDAGEALPDWSLLGLLGDAAGAISLQQGLTALNFGVQGAYKGWSHGRAATDPLVRDLGISANALGSALSILTAAMHMKTALMQGLAAEHLSDIAGSAQEVDRARDVVTEGAAEIASFKASIAAGKSLGSTLSAMGGFLLATPAGPILKIVGMAVTGAAIATNITKDSYQAGKVVEKEFEALYHGEAEESAEYVMRYGAEHRAASLVRKGRGDDEAALRVLAMYGISKEELAATPDAELRAKIIKHQDVGTKNLGTKLSEGVSGVGEYFSDSGGAMIQHYRADIAERTARAKDLMLYGEGAKGQTHNLTKVRAAAFFRTGPQVDNERKAQLEILKIKVAKRNHGLDPKTLELVTALLQPQSYYQALKADHQRKLRNVQLFGPGASIQHPGQGAAPA